MVIAGFAAVTVGLAGLIAQIILLRELLIVFSGNELSIGIILANWLVLEALGCIFSGRWQKTITGAVNAFGTLTLFFSTSLVAAVFITRMLRPLLGIAIGEPIGMLPILYGSFLILLPVSISHGAMFPVLCHLFSHFTPRRGSPIGMAYVFETIGCLLGGMLLTFLLLPKVPFFQTTLAVALLHAIAAIVLLCAAPRISQGNNAANRLLLGMLILLALTSGFSLVGPGAKSLHQRSLAHQWKNYQILHYENSLYGNLCVVTTEGQYLFFTDGDPSLILPFPDLVQVETFVHLAALSHPNPRDILVLSGGAGGVLQELLSYDSVARIDYAERNPVLIELLEQLATQAATGELGDPRVHTHVEDGRRFLATATQKYDIILVGLTDPSDLQSNRLFTREFFELAKTRLHNDGILVTGLTGSMTLMNDELRMLNACIYKSLQSVFPHVRALPGEGINLFLSSRSESVVQFDNAHMDNRLNELDPALAAAIPWHIEQRLHPGWREWFDDFVGDRTPGLNRDFKPLGVFYSLAHWNAIFTPRLRPVLQSAQMLSLRPFLMIFAVGLICIVLLRVRTSTPRAALGYCVGTSGFSGMLADLALIYAFQSLYGYVATWIALLTAVFMAGAACGALTALMWLRQAKPAGKALLVTEGGLMMLMAALAWAFAAETPLLAAVPTMWMKTIILALSAVSGYTVGTQFPLANALYSKNNTDIGRTAGVLYSADLLGGWLGGVLGGVLLLPVLGLKEACLVVLLLKLSSLILLALNTGKARETGIC